MKFRRICDQLVPADDEAAELYASLNDGDCIEVKVVTDRQRTHTQNNCLHKWLRQLAEDLNDAGLDMKKTLRHDAEIPWDMDRAKDFMWRPVQLAMTGEESTAEQITEAYPKIYEVIVRHLAQTHGFTAPPLPDRFNGGGQRAA